MGQGKRNASQAKKGKGGGKPGGSDARGGRSRAAEGQGSARPNGAGGAPRPAFENDRVRIGVMLAVTALALVWFAHDLGSWLYLDKQDALLAEVESLNSVMRSDGAREQSVVLRVEEDAALAGGSAQGARAGIEDGRLRLQPGEKGLKILLEQGTGGAVYRYEPLLGQARWIPRSLLSQLPTELWRSLLACLVGLLASASLMWRSRRKSAAS